MEKQTWLLGPLLWDVARYWQRFGEDGNNAGLFSRLYSDEESLHLFAAAIERGESNEALTLMQEALALAQGIPQSSTGKTAVADIVTSKTSASIPALTSILSNVRLKPEDIKKGVYQKLSPNALNVEFTEARVIGREAVQAHLNAFMAEMQFLQFVDSHKKVETVLSLIEKYFYCLPVLETSPTTDIPLFAVAKLVTAIAACWEKPAGQLPQVPDPNELAYTLIQGDLSGIQKYLYRIASAKGAAKGLKGRSFELSLLTDIVAKQLLLKFNLTSANIIYSSGGKFFVLAPAAALAEIPSLHAILERECYKQFDGAIFMGLAGVQLCSNDFGAEIFAQKWSAVSKACNLTKQRKFAALIVDNFSTVFGVQGVGEEKPTCDSCGQEESPNNKLEVQYAGTSEERKICPRCLRMEKLGRQLARAKYLVEVVNEPERSPEGDLVRLQPLNLDRAHRLTYYLIPEEQSPQFNGDAVTYFSFELQTFNEKHAFVRQLKAPEVQCGLRFYGGNDLPRNGEGEPLEYDDLANASAGLKRLGVLRMDVDNLGEIFRIGLGKNAAPARVMALSWHLNYFFTYRLNQLRDQEEYMNHILVVYSGGDDLFVVGSWDRVVDFAVTIRDEFRAFANNPQFSISGGVAIVPRKFPIHKAAEFSGEAEAAAKQLDDGAKNAFTLLDKPLRWSDFDLANSIRCELLRAIKVAPGENGEAPSLNKGIIDRLRRIYGLYDQNRRNKDKWLKATQQILQMPQYLEMLRYDKWRWMLTYSLWRYRNSNKTYEDLIKRLQEALINNKWIDQDGNTYPTERDVIGFIDLPTRWVEFLTRDETKQK